jgi:hypothetical protein
MNESIFYACIKKMKSFSAILDIQFQKCHQMHIQLLCCQVLSIVGNATPTFYQLK